MRRGLSGVEEQLRQLLPKLTALTGCAAMLGMSLSAGRGLSGPLYRVHEVGSAARVDI